jgi:hypothetical protein
MFSVLNRYKPWLYGFISVNIIATIIMFNKKELIGDFSGVYISDPTVLFFPLLLIIFSYWFFMVPLFNFLTKLKMKNVKFKTNDKKLSIRIGLLILVIQLLFFLFNSYYGVNVAGDNNTVAATPLAIIWVFIPADTLFVIYYAVYRNDKLFKLNLAIWLLSNILRGWAGVVLFVIFFEWCRLHRLKLLSYSKIFFAFIFVSLLYPLLSIFKWSVRTSVGKDISLYEILKQGWTAVSDSNYFDLIWFGLEHIVARLQLTAPLVELVRLKETFQVQFLNGHFLPFWLEGLHGIFIERMYYGIKTHNLSVAFTEYATFNWIFEVGDWNINPSLPSWFFITPHLSFIFILYLFFLCFLSLFLSRIISSKESLSDLIWLSWLLYLIPLWLGTFVAFIYALLFFLLCQLILSSLPNFVLSKKRSASFN